jgi:hypothetical protein
MIVVAVFGEARVGTVIAEHRDRETAGASPQPSGL